jgi:pimeloyl-ACP methyl ester carboxylesterase
VTHETGFVEVEGGRLYYEVDGDGPPLTLIHAGIANLRMWDEQVPDFAKRYRVNRYDTRGFGRTTTEPVSFSNRQDVADLLDHLGVERTHLLGCSRAGSIAIDFTLEFPQRVASLIAVASGLGGHEHEDPDAATFEEEAERLYDAKQWEELVEREVAYWVDGPGQAAGRAPASVRDRVREWQLETYRTQTVEGQPRVLEPRAAERLGEIQVPTLVIRGDLDESGVASACERIARDVPGARAVVIPGTAHMLSMERPNEFNRIVLDFLAAAQETSPAR